MGVLSLHLGKNFPRLGRKLFPWAGSHCDMEQQPTSTERAAETVPLSFWRLKELFVKKLQTFSLNAERDHRFAASFQRVPGWFFNCIKLGEGWSFLSKEQMAAQNRDFRKAFWVEVVLLLILAAPVVAWASGITGGIGTAKGSLTATEPTALTLLGSALITLGVLIRRFKS